MSYDLSDYVDVAERITIFREKHPAGSLQSSFQFTDRDGAINGVVVCAHAYRTPDDERPGIGHSFCPIPGTTRFTENSEIENAETSAWGRAIVAALAADTKRGVASANEIAAKTVPSNRAPQQGAGSSGWDFICRLCIGSRHWLDALPYMPDWREQEQEQQQEQLGAVYFEEPMRG